jgi:hypothetical protein
VADQDGGVADPPECPFYGSDIAFRRVETLLGGQKTMLGLEVFISDLPFLVLYSANVQLDVEGDTLHVDFAIVLSVA